jgi:hypothetical protein
MCFCHLPNSNAKWPDVRFTLDDAIKQAEHYLNEYNALLTRYGRSGNAARP